MVRLQKFLADAGIASRRAGEQFILQGRVEVNGAVVDQLGTKVDPLHDKIRVDGQPVRTKRKLYVALNKPRGCVCSRKDEFDRPTIYELLPKEWDNLYSVGRLDYDTEGLIFLTNDGQFALRLTHPRYEVSKKYVATVEGRSGTGDAGRVCARCVSRRRQVESEKGAPGFSDQIGECGGAGADGREKSRSAPDV